MSQPDRPYASPGQQPSEGGQPGAQDSPPQEQSAPPGQPGPYGSAPHGPSAQPGQSGPHGPDAPYGEPGPFGPAPYGPPPSGQPSAPYGQTTPYGQPSAVYGQATPYGQPTAPYGQAGGYGQPGLPVPAWARVRDPMPDGPREYQQMNRGGRYAWWRPLLTMLLCAVLAVAVQSIAGLVVGVILVATGSNVNNVMQRFSLTGPMDPVLFAVVLVSLISLIPSAMLASWVVNGIRPRFLSSVAGGFRWRWLARCLAIVVPIFVIYLGVQFATGWNYGPRPKQWGILLAMVIIAIPFQSAGEEYAFRGLILQNVGAWFSNPKVSLVVAIIPSVILFALAHGSFDPWVFADLAVFALASCILVWRTGGLEASVALHATNNVTLMIATILFGGWDQTFVTSATVGSPVTPLIELLVNGIVVALILWQANRVGLQRIYQPQPRPAVTSYPYA